MADKVTVVARWETGQMSPLKEWKMWRQLKGAFEIDRFIFVPVQEYMKGHSFEQYDTMEEALASLSEFTSRCFLEPSGYNSVEALPHGDIALIIGNTDKHNMEHAHVNETFAIKSPAGISAHLYGTNAAAIALAYEYGQ